MSFTNMILPIMFYFVLNCCKAFLFLTKPHVKSSDTQKSLNKVNKRTLPGHDNKEIQSVPRVPEVTALTKDSPGDHLYNHLQSEEDVDECIKSLTERHKETMCQE